MDIGMIYINSVQKRFEEMKQLGDRMLQQVSEQQIHIKPNDTSNSIAIIIQHLHGNMISRFSDFLTTDGEKETRDRDSEFMDKRQSIGAIATMWEQGWDTVFQALRQLTSTHLMQQVTIRGEQHDVFDAINRQLAHYSYHIGQMIYIAKWLKGEEWQSLSIPVGASKAYNDEMRQRFATNITDFEV